MSGGVQLDLFGEVLAAEEREREILAEREAWQARFERADWIAPWDCADGTLKGAVKPGWRCPDPDCRKVEPNAYLLSINHGWDPEVPEREPFDGRCHRLRLLESQARAAAARGCGSR